MYGRRRRFRRRRSGSKTKTIQHVIGQMSQSPTANTGSVIVLANAGNYATTGTAPTTIVGSISNKEQECTVGNKIKQIIIDLAVKGTSDVRFEYCVMKVERAQQVPAIGAELPTDAMSLASGAQYGCRTYQPGRVLEFGILTATSSQPLHRRISVPFSKFRMSTIRPGDFYVLYVFNRTGGTTVFDVHARFKEHV